MSRLSDVGRVFDVRGQRSTLDAPLTRGDTPMARRAVVHYTTAMRVLPRDHSILVYVARFGQVSTPQIKTLVFPDTSRTPCDRAVKRLVAARLLEPITLGMFTDHVYQLGSEAWPLFFTGKRKVQRMIRYHALAVADAYLSVLQASRAGKLDILEWQVESDAWQDMGGADLRPDLYLDIGVLEPRGRFRWWMEIDLGNERQKQIADKLERYIYAYDHAAGTFMPQVVFLCVTSDRVRDICRIIARTPHMPDGLVTAQLLADFPLSILQ